MHTVLGSVNGKRRLRRPLPAPPAFAEDALLTAREGAAFLRIGLSTYWLWVRQGRVPAPVRLSEKSPRWRLADLRQMAGGT